MSLESFRALLSSDDVNVNTSDKKWTHVRVDIMTAERLAEYMAMHALTSRGAAVRQLLDFSQ